MTDLTRIFIPVASDEANARSFAETVADGSGAAIRAAREAVTGQRLARQQDPLRIPLSGYFLISFLIAALALSIAGLTVRALQIDAHQHEIARM